MATPPTLSAEYETNWGDTTSPETSSVTVAAGDVLAIFGVVEDSGTGLATPTGGGLTYALQQSITIANNTAVYLWTAVSAGGQTFTLSVSETGDGTHWWGFNGLRFSGSAGVGNSAKNNANGAPSLSITPSAANSALVVVNGDWNAVDGASRTPRSIGTGSFTEQTYFRDASHYTVYGGFYTDSGSVAAKTVGWSAPSGQKYAVMAVEILGSSGAPTSLPPLRSAWARRAPLLVR